MRRIPAAVALLALTGGLVSMATPAGAEESGSSDASAASEAADLIVLDGVLAIDLVSLALDATLTVAGTGVADVTVVVGVP
jgi:hypothetical protein